MIHSMSMPKYTHVYYLNGSGHSVQIDSSEVENFILVDGKFVSWDSGRTRIIIPWHRITQIMEIHS